MSLDPVTEAVDKLNSILTKKEIKQTQLRSALKDSQKAEQDLNCMLIKANAKIERLESDLEKQAVTIDELTNQIAEMSHEPLRRKEAEIET